MFKRNTKSKKENLKHINGVYYVFKKYIIEKAIEDETPYIQLMLKNYLENKEMLIPDEEIETAKEAICQN